jgi:hypothetical protein
VVAVRFSWPVLADAQKPHLRRGSARCSSSTARVVCHDGHVPLECRLFARPFVPELLRHAVIGMTGLADGLEGELECGRGRRGPRALGCLVLGWGGRLPLANRYLAEVLGACGPSPARCLFGCGFRDLALRPLVGAALGLDVAVCLQSLGD